MKRHIEIICWITLGLGMFCGIVYEILANDQIRQFFLKFGYDLFVLLFLLFVLLFKVWDRLPESITSRQNEALGVFLFGWLALGGGTSVVIFFSPLSQLSGLFCATLFLTAIGAFILSRYMWTVVRHEKVQG